jgi:hypothetical protein
MNDWWLATTRTEPLRGKFRRPATRRLNAIVRANRLIQKTNSYQR